MKLDGDTHTAQHLAKRVSERMARVRSKNTGPEVLVRKYLHGQGFRFKLHDSTLPGTPDIVLPKFRTTVFIQGCFWHSHGKDCTVCSGVPKTNTAFWLSKLARNVERDQTVQSTLRKAGWQVLLVWGCELKKKSRGATLHRLSIDILNAEVCSNKCWAETASSFELPDLDFY